MKRLLLLLTSFCCLSGFAQRPSTNQYDAHGKKDGLWIEKSEWSFYSSYKNGELNGLTFNIGPKRTISGFAVYKDNQPVGTFVECDDFGRLLYIVLECGKNTSYSITDEEGKRYIPDYKGYFIGYYADGLIESEGILVWDKEDELQTDSINYGVWKYYDRNGNVTIKHFPQ